MMWHPVEGDFSRATGLVADSSTVCVIEFGGASCHPYPTGEFADPWADSDSWAAEERRQEQAREREETLRVQRGELGAVNRRLQEAAELVAGSGFRCALMRNGGVSCWGRGPLGDAVRSARGRLPIAVHGLDDAIRIAAGSRHVCAVRRDNTLWCWGANDLGQLGRDLPPFVALPTRIEDQNGVVDVAASGGHTCSRRFDGEVQCWGLGGRGQLGDGVLADRSVPSRLDFDEPVKDVAMTGATTCALLDSGRISCLRRSGDFSVTIPGARRLLRGEHRVCALSDSRLACWAPPTRGEEAIIEELGSNVVEAAHSGGVACWTTDDSAFCHSVSGRRGLLRGMQVAPDQDGPLEVPELAGARRLSLAGRHACVVRRDRTVACWGANRRGQLGNGTTDSAPRPVLVALPGPARDVATAPEYSCAALMDGTVWCWGSNRHGQLGWERVSVTEAGRVDNRQSLTPRRVAGVSDIHTLATGARHVCGLDSEGQVFCWGDNSRSQRGTDAPTQSHHARRVDRLPRVRRLVGGFNASCALTSRGDLYCWGADSLGHRVVRDPVVVPIPEDEPEEPSR